MESRWILFPGQTLSNTKISDRHHALHITEENWGKITRHLDRHKIKQEELDKEEAWKRYLRDGSRKMMENWENSLENIRTKKEEEKLKRIAQKKDDRMQRYFEIRKEQEQLRKEYIDKVQKHLFRSTGYAKQLTSAFIESEMLYEREKQKEFDQFLKKHEEQEEAKYAEKVKENARKEAEEKKEEQRKAMEKGREYGAYLKSVIQSNKETNDKLREERIRKEIQDNIMAMEETECLEKAEEKEKLKQKQEMFIEKKKAEKALADRKRQTQKEHKEMNDVIEIYQETKHRIDCMKKEREKEIQGAMVARRAAVAGLVSAKQQAKDDEEERVRKNAIAEREKAEAERLLEKLEFSRKMKQDRLDDRKQFVERQKIQKQKEIELKKWEMINRYKTDEVMKEYDENNKREQWRKVLEYRKELLEQIKEDKEEAQRIEELEKTICRINMNTDNADKKFFEYANEVMEQAKRTGRPTYPIEKVILDYKKTNSLPAHVEKKIFDNESKSNSEPKIKKLVKKKQCRCNNTSR